MALECVARQPIGRLSSTARTQVSVCLTTSIMQLNYIHTMDDIQERSSTRRIFSCFQSVRYSRWSVAHTPTISDSQAVMWCKAAETPCECLVLREYWVNTVYDWLRAVWHFSRYVLRQPIVVSFPCVTVVHAYLVARRHTFTQVFWDPRNAVLEPGILVRKYRKAAWER